MSEYHLPCAITLINLNKLEKPTATNLSALVFLGDIPCLRVKIVRGCSLMSCLDMNLLFLFGR